jgi:hypothetical protein
MLESMIVVKIRRYFLCTRPISKPTVGDVRISRIPVLISEFRIIFLLDQSGLSARFGGLENCVGPIAANRQD